MIAPVPVHCFSINFKNCCILHRHVFVMRTYGKQNQQLFPKRWSLSYLSRTEKYLKEQLEPKFRFQNTQEARTAQKQSLGVATIWEIAARSVSKLFSLYFVYLYYLFISRFGFKSGICLLIAPVPVHCFSITFGAYTIT